MSTGSTHSFLSICRMRTSAEIGSEKITRSTRVRRANSTRPSTVPSLPRAAALASGRAFVAAVVEHADHVHVGVALRLDCLDERLAGLAAAHHDRSPFEPALVAPVAHHRRQYCAEADQCQEADDVAAGEPD